MMSNLSVVDVDYLELVSVVVSNVVWGAATLEVFRGDREIDLSPTEFKLLRYLMLNPNRVLSKAQILDHVWEYDFNGDASIVESYISYLRRKIDNNPELPSLIHTKRGVGYLLRTSKN